MRIGEVLKSEAKDRGWTLREVAAQADISRQSVLRAYSSQGSLITLHELGTKVFRIPRADMNELVVNELLWRAKNRHRDESRPKTTPKPTKPATAKAKGKTLPS
jgi:hypothetical protein